MKLAQKIILGLGLVLIVITIINLLISHFLIDVLLILLGVLLILIGFNKKLFEEGNIGLSLPSFTG